MTRDLGERDAPGGFTAAAGDVADGAAPRGAGGEGEQPERSDEPFALLRAAIERKEEPERTVRVRG